MTDDEKIARLTQALNEPESNYTHDQIRAKLGALKAKAAPAQAAAAPAAPAPTPKMVVDLGLGPREYDDTNDAVPRVVRGLRRIGDAISGPALAYNKYIDSVTGGLYSAGTEKLSKLVGTQIGPSRADYERLAREHPLANSTATVAGIMQPLGVAAKEAEVVGGGLDLLRRVIKAKPATVIGRVAERAATTGAKGAASSALYGATEDAVQGKPFNADKAIASAKTGGAVGTGLGAASGAGAEFAAARKAANPDIAKLDEYGLEPGPVPGRPVIRKDQPITSQLPGGSSPPPLGVNRATPATRGEAARAAADEIVPDIRLRERVNNQRFGEMQRQAYASQGHRPVHADATLAEIDAHINDAGLPDSTRAALGTLRDRIASYGTPTQQGLVVRARHFDRMRDLADTLGRQEKAAKASDVPLRQISDFMRNEVRTAAPRIGMVNEMQHELLGGMEERRAMLKMPKGQEVGPAARESTREEAARRIRQSGEATGLGGVRTSGGQSAAERLSDMGPPDVFPGAQSRLPTPPDYKSLLDVPRLQLAQENLQAIPSRVFSGGGKPSGPSMVSRFAGYLPDRLLYPLGRRLGGREIGSSPAAVDELTHALRRRGKKKRQGAEMSTGGDL